MKRFLQRHNELLTLPVAILVWYFLPFLIRMVDPTAGAHDTGIIQSLVMAWVALLFGTAMVWLMLRIGAPDIYRKLDDYMHHNENKLTKWEQGRFVLAYYFGLLSVYALLVLAFA